MHGTKIDSTASLATGDDGNPESAHTRKLSKRLTHFTRSPSAKSASGGAPNSGVTAIDF